MLTRNTERRVEAFLEIKAENTTEDVLEIMEAFRRDVNNSWIMQPDGTCLKMPVASGEDAFERLYRYFSAREVLPKQAAKPTAARKRFFARLFRKEV